MSDLRIGQGDDRTLRFTVRDKDDTSTDPLGAPVDLTGSTIRFITKRHQLDAAAVFIKSTGGSGITLRDQVTAKGQLDVQITGTDTSPFVGSTVLLFELEVTDGAGKVQTVDEGYLLVDPQLG